MKKNVDEFNYLSNAVRQNLKKERLQRNISQQQIADVLGYKNRSDYNIRETGKKTLQLDEILKICFKFGIPISAIFTQSLLQELDKQINTAEHIPGTCYKHNKPPKEFCSKKVSGSADFIRICITLVILIILILIYLFCR